MTNQNRKPTMTNNLEVGASPPAQSEKHALSGQYQEPITRSEKYLASLWREIIGLERVTLPDKFLDVGGNSLTLNIILNRIEKETGASVQPQLFFDPDRSSLFDLARELDALIEDKPDRSQ
jgi:hypothetical protein